MTPAAQPTPQTARKGPFNVACALAAALLILGVAADLSCAERLEDERLVFEEGYEVYSINGRGQDTTKVLAKVETRSGASAHERLFHAYFQPSLSPDGRRVACIRYRNYSPVRFNDPELIPIQSSEILIVSVHDGAETIVYTLPEGQFDALGPSRGVRKRSLSAPVFSLDGGEVFFLAGNRLLVYRLQHQSTEEVVRLPVGYAASTTPDYTTSTYIRLSADGKKVFALVDDPGTNVERGIWRIDLALREATKLWSGLLDERSVIDVRVVPREVDDEGAEALFGSREFPVLAPRFSSDRRYYFFVKLRLGFFAKMWIGGYDKVSGREFVVKTLRRGLYWE